MKAQINRYGQLVVEHGKFPKGYYSVINGIEVHVTDYLIEMMAMTLRRDLSIKHCESWFNFHEAINDYK